MMRITPHGLRWILLIVAATTQQSCTAMLWEESLNLREHSSSRDFRIHDFDLVETSTGTSQTEIILGVPDDSKVSSVRRRNARWLHLRGPRDNRVIEWLAGRSDCEGWRFTAHTIAVHGTNVSASFRGVLREVGRLLEHPPPDIDTAERPPAIDLPIAPWLLWLGGTDTSFRSLRPVSWMRSGAACDPPDILGLADPTALAPFELCAEVTGEGSQMVAIRGEAVWLAEHCTLLGDMKTFRWHRSTSWTGEWRYETPRTSRRKTITAHRPSDLLLTQYEKQSLALSITLAVLATPIAIAGDCCLAFLTRGAYSPTR